MTKPKLSELAKARVDGQTKQQLEQLKIVFDHHDESDTVRAALAYFIRKHARLLPRHQPLGAR